MRANTPRRHSEEPSLPEAMKDLAENLSALVRADLEAARAEMVEKAKNAGLGAGMLSGSAVTGLLTIICLTGLAAVGLSAIVKVWIAALIVTLFWGIVTAVLVLVGKRKLQKVGPPIPQETIEMVKEEVATIRDELT
ncbi:MAG: hypothetical protein NVS1B14_07320 [Vulcanimicrobiaceae bacterium]